MAAPKWRACSQARYRPYLTLYYADSLGCGGAGLGAEKSAQQNHGPSKLDLALEEF